MRGQLSSYLILSGSLVLGLTTSFPSLAAEPAIQQRAKATYYSDKYQGRKTATGERFDQNKPTAASKTLPLGSKAQVTNVETGKTVEVEITDRMPKGGKVDLSKSAADNVGLDGKEGTAPVKVEVKPSDQPNEQLKNVVANRGAGAAPARR